MTLRPRKGPPPLESDRTFIGSLRITSLARAFLKNMRPSRARDGVARTLSKREIEERLDEMLRRSGDQRLEIAMTRTPDGDGRLELSRFLTPPAVADRSAGLRSAKATSSLVTACRRLSRSLSV